jgi:hypothetical protein
MLSVEADEEDFKATDKKKEKNNNTSSREKKVPTTIYHSLVLIYILGEI